MEIVLDLRKHCIETAAKRAYNRLLSEVLRGRARDSASEAELLRDALTRLDFPSLRAAHKALAGKSGARVSLTDNGAGPPGITIDGRPVDMAPHIRG